MKILNNKSILVGFEDFELPEGVEVIGCNATSTEHLDKYREMGIKVIDLKGETKFLETITSTAEHTIGLIIALLRNYKTALNAPYKDRDSYRGRTLSGKTILLIGGNGRVGRQVRDRAEAFEMKVLIYEKNEPIENLYKDLEESDVASIHIPLSNNESFFSREFFSLMKPTSYLINTSRLGVVDNSALLKALESGKIAGAAVDFIEDKKLVEYARTHNNLILTNHQGGNTYEDRQRTEDFIIKKITDYLNEKN